MHTSYQLELAQEESINPAPFRFTPLRLAHLVDPKDLETLTALGGMDGIIGGLGTHPEHGLRTTSLLAAGNRPQRADRGASSNHGFKQQAESSQPAGVLPNVMLSQLSGKEGGNDVPYSGTIDDRKHVYGVNVLPTRKSKTLLQLAAAALTDKVLVCDDETASETIISVLYPLIDPAIGRSRRFSGVGTFQKVWYA
jgi:Ca2+-transporting ATPase